MPDSRDPPMNSRGGLQLGRVRYSSVELLAALLRVFAVIIARLMAMCVPRRLERS